MHVTTFDRGWRFRQADAGPGFWQPHAPTPKWRPAQVPGHVHADLVRNGLIADPFTEQHEAGCQWVDLAEWEYEIEFEWHPREEWPRRVLRFEGLDTVAAVHLNDEPLATSDNMFVPLEADVTGRLQPGLNRLHIRFASAVRSGMERRAAYFEGERLPHDTALFDERAFVRKVQCMSGWDWGPRLVSCGVWRPVRLLEFSARIRAFEVFQEALPDGRFRVFSRTDIEGEAALATTFGDEPAEGDFDRVVDAPRLWWPNGEGEPHLYRATARLSTGAEASASVGLRTVHLLREPDAWGESFEFEVNGRRLWARGANWIPADALPSRVHSGHYVRAARTCSALNMNMLRVWGGGLYEDDAFYDACDEAGILVWQDFPFACSYYPDDAAFQDAVRREAEHHVRRLRTRTCLALWCGNNENDTMWESKWGGLEKSPPRYYGDALYSHVLPEVVETLDPDRPYLRSSPTGTPPSEADSNSGGYGDQHYWDAWHGRGDWIHYRESTARFSSEFGFASSCSLPLWRAVVGEESEATPESDTVRWHDRTGKPWNVFKGFVEEHYPAASTLEEWVVASQLNQRDALRCAIEHYRASEFCRGALIWQFNDCWPVQSWAIEDGSGALKPAGFELRRLFAPTVVCVQVDEGWVRVRLAHDGAQPRRMRVMASALDTVDGHTIATEEAHVELAPGTRVPVFSMDLGTCERERTAVCAWIDGVPESRTWRTLAEPKAMRWASPSLRALWSEGVLELRVAGLAYDAVLIEPAKATRAGTSLTGCEAHTLAAESAWFECPQRPESVRVRHLGGVAEVAVEDRR